MSYNYQLCYVSSFFVMCSFYKKNQCLQPILSIVQFRWCFVFTFCYAFWTSLSFNPPHIWTSSLRKVYDGRIYRQPEISLIFQPFPHFPRRINLKSWRKNVFCSSHPSIHKLSTQNILPTNNLGFWTIGQLLLPIIFLWFLKKNICGLLHIIICISHWRYLFFCFFTPIHFWVIYQFTIIINFLLFLFFSLLLFLNVADAIRQIYFFGLLYNCFLKFDDFMRKILLNTSTISLNLLVTYFLVFFYITFLGT